jgi:hypothetical protein
MQRKEYKLFQEREQYYTEEILTGSTLPNKALNGEDTKWKICKCITTIHLAVSLQAYFPWWGDTYVSANMDVYSSCTHQNTIFLVVKYCFFTSLWTFLWGCVSGLNMYVYLPLRCVITFLLLACMLHILAMCGSLPRRKYSISVVMKLYHYEGPLALKVHAVGLLLSTATRDL